MDEDHGPDFRGLSAAALGPQAWHGIVDTHLHTTREAAAFRAPERGLQDVTGCRQAR